MELNVVTKTQELANTLTFINYCNNRTTNPNISAARWAEIYGASAAQMEAKYLEITK